MQFVLCCHSKPHFAFCVNMFQYLTYRSYIVSSLSSDIFRLRYTYRSTYSLRLFSIWVNSTYAYNYFGFPTQKKHFFLRQIDLGFALLKPIFSKIHMKKSIEACISVSHCLPAISENSSICNSKERGRKRMLFI